MSETDLLQSYIKRAVKDCLSNDGGIVTLDQERLRVRIQRVSAAVYFAYAAVNNSADDEGNFGLDVSGYKVKDAFAIKVADTLACEIIDQFYVAEGAE